MRVLFCSVAFATLMSNAVVVNTAEDSIGVIEYGEAVSIAYNPEWCGVTNVAGAVSVLEVDGMELVSLSGEGDYRWSPPSIGEYCLSLKVVANGVQIGSVLSRTLRVQKTGVCYGIKQPSESMTATSAVVVVDARVSDDVIAARSTENITYSSLWSGGENSTARVCVNGVEVKSASGSGEYQWRPLHNGEYVFAHTTMRDGAQVGEALTATFVVDAESAVKNLKVTQIAPWGLALDFEVEGAAANHALEVKVITGEGAVTNVARTLSGDVGCVNGAHRVYWNTAKDGISIERERAKIEVGFKATVSE